jgi:hypothetical protein
LYQIIANFEKAGVNLVLSYSALKILSEEEILSECHEIIYAVAQDIQEAEKKNR